MRTTPASALRADPPAPGGLLTVRPSVLNGTVAAPPSKSVTHRALLLGAQGPGCRVEAPLLSADTAATLRGLALMGSRFTLERGPDGAQAGDGARPERALRAIVFDEQALRPAAAPIDCANSATTLRLLAVTSARFPMPTYLVGDGSLSRRPQGTLEAALRARGAQCSTVDGHAPVRVQGPLAPGRSVVAAGDGSQPASGLLLSLPFLEADSTLDVAAPIASRPYLDLTLQVAGEAGLRMSAAPSSAGGLTVQVPGGQRPSARRLRVDGDWSSAAFLLAAAAVTGGDVTVTGLAADSPQGDVAVVQLLQRFGARCAWEGSAVRCHGGAPLAATGDVDASAVPDLVPALAIVAAVSRGRTQFRGIRHLRGKETDRLDALQAGLTAMGIRCSATPDTLLVEGGRPTGARIASRGDHRIHMAFAVAGLAAVGQTTLDGAETVRVSYPGFHRDLARLGASMQGGPA